MLIVPTSQSAVRLAPPVFTSERDRPPVDTSVVSSGLGGAGPGWDLKPRRSAMLPPLRRAMSSGDRSPGLSSKNDAGSENTPSGVEVDINRSSGLNTTTLWVERET